VAAPRSSEHKRVRLDHVNNKQKNISCSERYHITTRASAWRKHRRWGLIERAQRSAASSLPDSARYRLGRQRTASIERLPAYL